MDTLPNMDRRTKRNGEWLTRTKLAERLEMSTKTVDRWAAAGLLPVVYHKLGRQKGRAVKFHWPAVARALKIPQ